MLTEQVTQLPENSPVNKGDQLEEAKQLIVEESAAPERPAYVDHGSDKGEAIGLEQLFDFVQRNDSARFDQEAVDELRQEVSGEEPAETPTAAAEQTPAVDTGVDADGVPTRFGSPLAAAEADLEQFSQWHEQAFTGLRKGSLDLQQKRQQVERLLSLDPVEGQKALQRLHEEVGYFQQAEAELNAAEEQIKSRTMAATKRACFGTENPSRKDIDALLKFAEKDLGLSAEQMYGITMQPRVAAAIARLHAQHTRPNRAPVRKVGAKPPTPRKVANRKSATMEEALQRLEQSSRRVLR